MLDISWIPKLPGPSRGSQDRQGFAAKPYEEATAREINDEQWQIRSATGVPATTYLSGFQNGGEDGR